MRRDLKTSQPVSHGFLRPPVSVMMCATLSQGHGTSIPYSNVQLSAHLNRFCRTHALSSDPAHPRSYSARSLPAASGGLEMSANPSTAIHFPLRSRCLARHDLFLIAERNFRRHGFAVSLFHDEFLLNTDFKITVFIKCHSAPHSTAPKEPNPSSR